MAKSVARDLAFVKSKVISRLLESDEFAKVMLRKEDFTDESFAELLYNLDLDEGEVGEELKLFAVVDSDCLKE